MIKAKEYFEKFTQLLNSGVPIINETTNEQFILMDDEEFKQCWADTPERKTFPKYWFVSNKGNLLSVYGDKIIWLHKNPRNKDEKGSYKYLIKTEEQQGKIKSIETHNLTGLVFNSESFGLAEELLKTKGVYAFGVKNKGSDTVQGHHKDGNHENNNPNNIKFVTDKVHILLDSVPSPDAGAEEYLEFMQKFGEIAEKENPNDFTVLFPGQSYNTKTKQWNETKDCDIVATKEIAVTQNFINELNEILKLVLEKQ